ncbi:hypothetical protein DYI95_002325 [Thermaerobacter sp. PB12/4term]|uniref:hypothetical protein n=1 Tax=Thermaerobacter sp. PB12/4term TaxID=2293838 RepID=UPI000E32C44F|nr:hypothetical protein [Thermaerobacter sp. PB12/4term]QIA26527.1 hypothetical protein DYI95_002325 [Thermaerobacter sp. PB12/4term]
MSGGWLRAHLRLARAGLGMAVALAAAFWPVLLWPVRLLGHPLHLYTLARILEEFLVLAVLPVAVPLWSDVEGLRPGWWRALPFRRAPTVAGRLLLPVAVYLVLAGTIVALAFAGSAKAGTTGTETLPLPALVRVVVAAVPPALLLSGLASVVAVAVRMPVAGAGAALAWWCLEMLTGGDLSGPLYLFATTHGLPLLEVEPARIQAALRGDAPCPAAFLANRWALVGLTGALLVLTHWLYRRDEAFLRR